MSMHDSERTETLHTPHRNLPHWTQAGAIYGMTLRSAFARPQKDSMLGRVECNLWIASASRTVEWIGKWEEYDKRFGKVRDMTRAGDGFCLLARSKIR